MTYNVFGGTLNPAQSNPLLQLLVPFGFCVKRRQEYRFSSQLAKYPNLYIIETSASILTKFCTMIRTIKYFLYGYWVLQHDYKCLLQGISVMARKFC